MLFYWNGEENEEEMRMKKWQEEDPIALQDAFNTSQALVDYCKNNDFEGMSQLVDEAERGEFLFAHTVQAFMIAVSNLQVEMIKKFLDLGLDLECEVFCDALHMAIEAVWKDPSDYRVMRVVQIIHMLNGGSRMSPGIPIDSLRLRDGFTPLCSACVVGFVKITDCLLSLKADPNMITRDNSTPLEIATRCEHEKVIARLAEMNAGTNAKDVLKKIRNPGHKTEVTKDEEVKTEDGKEVKTDERKEEKENECCRKQPTSLTCKEESRETNGIPVAHTHVVHTGISTSVFCVGVEE